MSKIKGCNNNYIFCFIKQLPKNLRPSLYVRDDDYLLSFMYGNFVTLTNLGQDDIGRIIKSKIEPLYVSLHSLDRRVRKIIFGSDNHRKGLENFKVLDHSNIRTHIQIVLCPDINDGVNLESTLRGLLMDYNNIKSIGIVPVGITKHNREARLEPVEKSKAREVISLAERINKESGRKHKIFLSDEFYLIAEVGFPEYSYYHNFCQIENGIGKSVDFLENIRKSIRKKKSWLAGKKIAVVTSEYGFQIFKKVKNIFRDSNIDYNFKVIKIKNEFLGGNVKVTGLISGKDLTDRLNTIHKDFDKILIPGSIFNRNGLTLDNYNEQDIKKISKSIKIIPEDAESLVKEL
ncbi:MAG: DUF512 domain-containing protein [Candidatus Humimicrobiaceae bacterium]